MNDKTTTRKIQYIGNSFTTTLPRKWIRKFSLEAGNEITIKMQDDGSLAILPNTNSDIQTQNEFIIEFYHEVGAEVREKCLSGVERIIIISQEPIETAELRRIRYFVKRMPTTRIISENPREVIIQNFGIKNLPSREMLHGMFSMTADILKIFREVGGNAKDEEVEYKFDQIMEFYIMLIQYIRTYQTSGHLHPKDYQDFNHKKASDYRTVCNYIRSIVYKLVALEFFDDGLEYYKEIEQYFNDTFDAFLRNGQDKKQTHKKAYGLYFDLLWKRGVELKETFDGEVRYMIKDLVSIYHDISDILFVINII